MSKDPKRTPESKATTLAIRTVRKSRTVEQRYTDRQYLELLRNTKLLSKGIAE